MIHVHNTLSQYSLKIVLQLIKINQLFIMFSPHVNFSKKVQLPYLKNLNTLLQKKCVFSYIYKPWFVTHVWDKLCGFIHHNVKYVMFIVTCITLIVHVDIQFYYIFDKCQTAILYDFTLWWLKPQGSPHIYAVSHGLLMLGNHILL